MANRCKIQRVQILPLIFFKQWLSHIWIDMLTKRFCKETCEKLCKPSLLLLKHECKNEFIFLVQINVDKFKCIQFDYC